MDSTEYMTRFNEDLNSMFGFNRDISELSDEEVKEAHLNGEIPEPLGDSSLGFPCPKNGGANT